MSMGLLMRGGFVDRREVLYGRGFVDGRGFLIVRGFVDCRGVASRGGVLLI